jgi:hypothetical protein
MVLVVVVVVVLLLLLLLLLEKKIAPVSRGSRPHWTPRVCS